MSNKYRKNSRNNELSIKGKLNKFQTHAYKKFGQNFLLDKKYVEFMIDGLNLEKGDFVIEIGPGMGALTEYLLEKEELKRENGKIRYLAVEIDLEKIVYLKQNFDNIDIENISILDFDIERFCKENDIKNYKVIGSLPFNISKQIIQKLSESAFRPEKAVLMVQKEVGDDYANIKKSTFLGIYLSQYWDVEDTQIIPSNAFFPAPKVDGMSLILKAKNQEVNQKFLKFVRRGFSSPRKKLGNVLMLSKNSQFYNKRPHELVLEDWQNLFDQNNSIG